MIDYEKYSDEQLLSEVAKGNGLAEEALLIRYSRLVRACAHKLYLTGGSVDDLVQEGMIGLHSAVCNYRSQAGVKFSTYAETCIKNRQYSAVRSANREKNTPLTTSLSIEELSEVSDSGMNHLYSTRVSDPVELLIARENEDEFTGACSACLSVFEQKVLRLYLDGGSYRQIGGELGKSEKSIDNAIQRIKRKLAQYLTQA